MTVISALGALVALCIAILLILKKVSPAYGMLIGGLFGGIIGGANLTETINIMMAGAGSITPAIMRMLAAGVLAGVLIESGAAHSIAETITKRMGEHYALLALSLATLILTAVGVFIDVAVITVSPIAIALARRTDSSKTAVLLAMVGGGKAGNIISPNPNAIAAADSFHLPLTSVMIAGIIPAIFGLIATYFLAKSLTHKGSKISSAGTIEETQQLPAFRYALVAPLVAIILLSLRPLFDITIDPLIALPIGGIIGTLFMGKFHYANRYAISGLNKMAPVAIMLLGTGALAGIISNSGLKDIIISGLNYLDLPSYLLAPVSGALMSLATGSTTAGTAVAANVFSGTLLELGVSSLAAAAMIHAGAMIGDHMPHGSFFHSSAGSLNMDMRERLRLLPYETLIALLMTFISTLIFGVFA